MKFQIPVELARKYPALTAQDMQGIRDHVIAVRENNSDLPETDIYRIAFQKFLTDKGIAY